MILFADESPLSWTAVVMAAISLIGVVVASTLGYLNQRDQRRHDKKLIMMEIDIQNLKREVAECEESRRVDREKFEAYLREHGQAD